MSTPAIPNIGNVAPKPQSGKNGANPAPDASFNDVLSREIDQRKPVEQDKVKEKDGSANADAAPEPVKAQGPDEGKTEEKTDAAATAEAPTATTTSADLLALVARLNQLAATPADAKAAVDTTAVAIDPNAKALPADGLAALTTPKEETAAKPEPGDFAAAAAKAAEPKPGVDAKVLAADIKPALDLGAKSAELPQATVAPLMQAALNALPAAAGAPKLTPHVGTPDWDNALGQKVVWMVAGGQQSASLTLNPPDLGPLHVVLNVSNSQATATFTAAQPEVRQALENAMPKLREMMGEAGIQLGQANVSAGTPNQQQQQFAEQSRGGGRGERFGDTSIEPARAARTEATSAGQGLINTFA